MAKRVQGKWSVAKKLADIKEDLRCAYDDDSTLRDLEESLEDSDEISLFSDLLDGIGTETAMRGAVALLEGDAQGWRQIHTGWRYVTWHHRVQAWQFDQELAKQEGKIKSPKRFDSLGVRMYETSIWLAAAIAMRQDGYADWAGQRMIRNYSSGDPLEREAITDGEPFAPFVVRLYARWRGVEGELMKTANKEIAAKPRGKKAAYQKVLDAWSDPDAFADSLVAMCEYYIEVTDDFGRKSPYDVFPAELAAIMRIRSELKLPTPKIDHPICDNPLLDVPQRPPKPKKDALWEKVWKRSSELEPKLDMPW